MSILYRLSWVAANIYIKARYKFEVKSRVDLQNLTGPIIMTPNHESYLDAYAVLISFPFFSKIHPIYTMAADWLYKNPLRRFYLKSVHTMPTFSGHGMDVSLKIPKEALLKGGAILFFPEGGLNVTGSILPKSKIGAVLLSKEMNIPLLPIAVKIENKLCKVSIGAPYLLENTEIEEARLEVMKKIRELEI